MGGVTVVSKKKGWLFHPPRKGSMVRSLRKLFCWGRIWWRQLDTPLVGLSNVAGMYSHRFADELNNNGSDWSWTTQLGRMAKDLEVSGCSNTVSLIPMNSGTWGEPGLWTRLLGHRLTWKRRSKALELDKYCKRDDSARKKSFRMWMTFFKP